MINEILCPSIFMFIKQVLHTLLLEGIVLGGTDKSIHRFHSAC